MIILISSDEKSFRKIHVDKILSEMSDSEVIFYDDTYGNILDLERYIFPSLFSVTMPIIHLKYVINENAAIITNTFIKKLASSPTVFLFEEMTTPPTVATMFKKLGAMTHIDTKKPIVKKDNIFSVTNIITNKDKKSRWLAYQKAISEYEIEAIIGILYWKMKDLISKNKEKSLQDLYTKMLEAHKNAWQKNIPLELSIEKVILNS